jgi:very-short-patch-repair endonuclease
VEAPRTTRSRARILRRKMSLPEVLLWRGLRRNALGGHFRRQHPMGVYVLDFYCDHAKLAVEVDSETHNLAGAPERDARRDAWLASQGVRTLRLPALYVLKNLADALDTIRAALDALPDQAASNPPTEGEGDRK